MPTTSTPPAPPTFLSLPLELRLQLLTYNLTQPPFTGFRHHDAFLPSRRGLYIAESYSPSDALSLLLVCRQFRADFTVLAFRLTRFIVHVGEDEGTREVEEKLRKLHPCQLSAIRDITLVVPSTELELEMMFEWDEYPFNIQALHLDTLAIAFDRCRQTHRLFPCIPHLIRLLRRLKHVKCIRFIHNGATLERGFVKWAGFVVRGMIDEDRKQRFECEEGPRLPDVWWEWGFDEGDQCFELVATEPMPVVEKSVFEEAVQGWLDGGEDVDGRANEEVEEDV
ncbi:hypothetical protein M011DRAFT_106456 [Sporormia fimetaria CBS 119925]|uniref:F-box domain-containing protein n=1 Tax=Sporormia fimetaria CBS 119925 TaxID=1340428 RepID=A0A6A6VN47_9PLEO|nr:hypothetical protein M011DRAFT_106456 [Sporormia fimetaria CBS 119925]